MPWSKTVLLLTCNICQAEDKAEVTHPDGWLVLYGAGCVTSVKLLEKTVCPDCAREVGISRKKLVTKHLVPDWALVPCGMRGVGDKS